MTKLKYKRKLSRFKVSSGIMQIIGERCKKRYIYKYISIDSAILCFQNHNVRFAEPSEWTDNCEKRFYQATYNQAKYPGYPKKLFAYCVTTEPESEPGWKMYTKQGITIELKLNLKRWREALASVCKNKFNLYEGMVSYDLTDFHLSILHLPTYLRKGIHTNVKGHNELFQKFDITSYLNLLLFKRKAYDYEHELRYFLLPSSTDKLDDTGKHCLLDINWMDIIEDIRVPTDIDESNLQKLINEIENMGYIESSQNEKDIIFTHNENKHILKIKKYNINKGKYFDDFPISID